MSTTPAREPVHDEIASFVKRESKPVSVAEIADAIDVSHSTALKRAKETRALGLIDGAKNTPVIAYDIGGSPVVITSRSKAMRVIRQHRPDLLDHAKDLSLDEQRKLIERHIAGDKFPVNKAWRFSKN